MKRQTVIITLLSLIFLANFPIKVVAETALERIERTGVINAGARKDATPFGYVDSNKQWTGYSVELMKLIQRRLEEKLKKPIKLNLEEVSVDNRFRSVQEGEVDIACGAATITQQRLQIVDFSVPYFMTGAQFLIKLSDASKFNLGDTLAKVPIAYIPQTTTDQIIRQIYPYAKWKPVSSRQEGVEELKRGEVRAVASDGILLVGELVRQGSDPRQFAVTPSQPLTTELYGCILPKDNLPWKEFVDNTIVSEANKKLQEQWFNVEQSDFPYPIRVYP